VIKEWLSMESDHSGFKIGSQGILKRGEGPMVKLYVLKLLSAKCVTKKRA
jgi:hypothetical protein